MLRRELASLFLSITGYVIIAAATLIIGLDFVVLMFTLGNSASPMPVTELFYGTVVYWLIVLLIIPVITMRLFALEKFTGTFETLMTTPVSDMQVVAAKFTAAIVFYIIIWLPLLADLFVVQHFANQHSALDTGTVGGMFLGIFLVGCLFLSLGCFTSSLTRSQMAAAVVSFVLGAVLFLIAFVAQKIEQPTTWPSQILSYFNLFGQIHNFARGIVDTRDVIFYLSLTFFFLFLTLRIVESRRWK